jgi:ABC-type dipeptide/oligopeptide/nickel transport system permease subunit
MRWILLPLLLLALLAPPQGCPRQLLIQSGEQTIIPPAPMGTAGAWLGTDVDGRDTACLVTRGVRQSLQIALNVLLLALLPALLLGLWMGWRGLTVGLYAEIFILAGLILLLGNSTYTWVLALGLVLYLARLVAVRVRAVLLEPFIEGARVTGGSTWHILTRHVLPHLFPVLPSAMAAGIGVAFLWMAELAVLGYFATTGYWVDFGSGYENVPMRRYMPLNPDLAQMIATARFEWLSHAEQLFIPALAFVLLTLGFADLGAKLTSKR